MNKIISSLFSAKLKDIVTPSAYTNVIVYAFKYAARGPTAVSLPERHDNEDKCLTQGHYHFQLISSPENPGYVTTALPLVMEIYTYIAYDIFVLIVFSL